MPIFDSAEGLKSSQIFSICHLIWMRSVVCSALANVETRSVWWLHLIDKYVVCNQKRKSSVEWRRKSVCSCLTGRKRAFPLSVTLRAAVFLWNVIFWCEDLRGHYESIRIKAAGSNHRYTFLHPCAAFLSGRDLSLCSFSLKWDHSGAKRRATLCCSALISRSLMCPFDVTG